ncbi:MAG TPA: hypothetical protein DD420_32205 [Streptomyces sp.]|uniref:hypothetical protein n=1 Tax=Streptomyces sp. SID3915 TaxID=2690263 RepID=UPI000E938CB7|nr:hypothetical protein [Streptomyces sp. SID3915]MYX75083.1 hypothetical protein [Streptomyces sp. SID3915]HBF84426.1 hypothetical protein [Streptomyces sp.]
MSVSQDGMDQALHVGLLIFCASVGLLSVAGLLLLLAQLAADTAQAIAAAGPAGIGITVALRKGK